MQKPGDALEEAHNTNKVITGLTRKASALDVEETESWSTLQAPDGSL